MTEPRKPFPIPVVPAVEPPQQEDPLAASCASGEPYALMVLGDSMLPEFEEGWVIVVEPEGVATDGTFVVAQVNDEYIFRQLIKHPDGWMLKPLNPLYPNIPIESVEAVVKGVVVLKKKPGRRKEFKAYA